MTIGCKECGRKSRSELTIAGWRCKGCKTYNNPILDNMIERRAKTGYPKSIKIPIPIEKKIEDPLFYINYEE